AAYYLESHARRVYGSASESELAAAKAILKHVRIGDLCNGFTPRDVHQRGWANLTEREQVGAGLSLLVDLDYLALSALSVGRQRRAAVSRPPHVKARRMLFDLRDYFGRRGGKPR